LSLLGGTGVTSTALGNGVTLAIDATVATLDDAQTLTNKTLTTPAITGPLTTDSTIDGRDVAVDGTKLDGIEVGATADQTAAEIRTLVEAATDSNVFTDADHTKLNGIEALADVTDVTNVTAAGALMDSELTSIASVKALDQGVATTDSPSFVGLTTSGEITANGGIALGDNDKATFGASDDLQIYHDGSNSWIQDLGTGSLILKADGPFISLQNSTGNDQVLVSGTTVRLSHSGSEKLATTATGIDVTGNVDLPDNGKLLLGASDDLQIYHDGGHSYINDTGSGNLKIKSGAGFDLQTTTGENYLDAVENGAINLYYDNSKKLATTATGIDVTPTR
jgi:hypothetical protein